jgi:hypothetical protein
MLSREGKSSKPAMQLCAKSPQSTGPLANRAHGTGQLRNSELCVVGTSDIYPRLLASFVENIELQAWSLLCGIYSGYLEFMVLGMRAGRTH